MSSSIIGKISHREVRLLLLIAKMAIHKKNAVCVLRFSFGNHNRPAESAIINKFERSRSAPEVATSVRQSSGSLV